MSKETAPKKDELTELKIDKVRSFWRMLTVVALLVGFGLGICGGWFVAINAMGDATSVVTEVSASLKK